MRIRLLIFIGCWLVLASTVQAQGSIFTVTKTADTNDGTCDADCSLREAITAANADPGSTVNIPAGTYMLTRTGANEDNNVTGDLDITSPVIISGAGAANTMIDGRNLDRVFHITGAYPVSIQHVKIGNGRLQGTGGGLYNLGGTLTLDNVSFTGNGAQQIDLGIGGALANAADGIVTVINGNFSTNTAALRGGAISSAGSLTVINTIFDMNTGDTGGAIWVERGTASVTNSVFIGGSAAYGAGVLVGQDNAPGQSATLSLTHSTLAHNRASVYGGGIFVNANGTASLRANVLANNMNGNCLLSHIPGGSLTSAGYNFSDTGACLVSARIPTDQFDTNPLVNRKGYLMALSPAIDTVPAEECPLVADVMGAVRPQGGGCDSGALEFQPIIGSSFTVTKTTDTNDGLCDADCSLREAILAANATSGSTLHLPAGNYVLSLIGSETLRAEVNDLDILAPMTISGAGAETTIIDANGIDRVFDIDAVQVVIVGVTIRGGYTTGTGGGVLVSDAAAVDASVTIKDSILTANQAQEGGGLGGIYASASLVNTHVTGNTAVSGGGLSISIGALNFSNGVLNGNTTTNNGIIYLGMSGYAVITSTTLSNNAGGGITGGNQSVVTVHNTTIAGHTGGSTAAAIRSQYRLQVLHTTTANNTMYGLRMDSSGQIYPYATLLSNNSSGNCLGSIYSRGYNLSDNTTCSTNFVVTTDHVNVNPYLLPLAMNGGVGLTMLLGAGSAAQDVIPPAACYTVQDQRGFARPQNGACDIGAVESDLTATSPQRAYYTQATPTLSWTAVPNAAVYVIEVDDDADFGSPIYTAEGIADLFVTTDPLPDDTYYWRVRMVNASGVPGMWSLVDSFVVDVP